KVVIGGACTSEQLKEEMGADAYGETAVQAVTIFNEFSAHA
ncbi:MAG: methionine synthase, partial [Deltaproteobacteria bacterium]|nr:methionine synthase [Deltaproteobacteria bacterium]